MDLLIDGDPLVYACGFGAQTHLYHVMMQNPDGELEPFLWQDGNKLRQWEREHITEGSGWVTLSRAKAVIPLPRSKALHILDGRMYGIIDSVRKLYGETRQVHIMLTGSNNFRFDIATVKPYKGNRVNVEKPVHYALLRKHLIERWGAEIVDNQEADDAISIAAQNQGGEYVICSNDKDLDQIPGLHYDYMKEVGYEVSPEDGQLFFYQQILSGDSTDNIPGLRGVGSKRAGDMIAAWQAEYTGGDGDWDAHVWGRIVSAYEEIGVKDYDGPKGAEELALEMARLVRMQQYDGELWVPPGHEERTV